MSRLKFVLTFALLMCSSSSLANPFTVFRDLFKWYERTYRPFGNRYVYMNDCVEIQLQPTDKPRILITEDLDGCSCSILFQKSKSNQKRALLSHFNPRCKPQHLSALAEHASWQGEEVESCIFVVVLPDIFRYTAYSFADQEWCNKELSGERKNLEQVIAEHLPQVPIQTLHHTYDLVRAAKDMSTTSIQVCLSNEEPSCFKIRDAGKNKHFHINLE